MEIQEIVAKLRRGGGDSVDVEAKNSSGGLSPSVNSTICALANLPGGGIIILGLDEANNFQPVNLGNLQSLKQGLVGKARACVPPVQIEFLDQDEAVIEGVQVVVAFIKEADKALKPVKVSQGGKGYARWWDGDYELSPLEEQAFQSLRNHPDSDRKRVEGATREDLDPDLLALFEKTAQERDGKGLGRYSGEELYLQAGVTTDVNGTPSVAGLLALGKYPQKFFPRLIVNVAIQPRGGGSDGQAINAASFAGPIPVMLESTMDWARKNFDISIDKAPDGRGGRIDRYAYPLDAFRELIGNALAHRDLAEWSRGNAIEVRLESDRLVVQNPGGLFGITVSRLGLPGVSSARNARLVEILKYIHTSTGERVIETLASGMPIIFKAANDAGMPRPIFQDTGINLRVIWHQLNPVTVAPTPTSVIEEDTFTPVRNALLTRPMTISALMAELDMKRGKVRYHLDSLIERGEVEPDGGVGKTTVYRLVPSPRATLRH